MDSTPTVTNGNQSGRNYLAEPIEVSVRLAVDDLGSPAGTAIDLSDIVGQIGVTDLAGSKLLLDE